MCLEMRTTIRPQIRRGLILWNCNLCQRSVWTKGIHGTGALPNHGYRLRDRHPRQRRTRRKGDHLPQRSTQ